MPILLAIQSMANPFLDRFFILMTMLGEDYAFMIAVCLIIWCIHKDFGYRFGFAYLTGAAFCVVLKEIVRIPRPVGRPGIRSLRLETAPGYSFPSGHAQCGASFWYSLIRRIQKTWFSLVGAAFILLIAFSRLYLGVHYLSDVIAGILIGIIVVVLVNRLCDGIDKSGKKHRIFILLIPIAAGLFFPSADYFKAAGTCCGFIAGFLIEPRFIAFKVQAKLWQHFVKMLIGLSLVVFFQIFLKKVFPDMPAYHFLRYLVISVWVTIGAPGLFKVFFQEKNETAVSEKKTPAIPT